MTEAEGKGRHRALFGRILGKWVQAWARLDRGKEVTPKKESRLDQWLKMPPRERLYDLPGYREEAEEVALPREVVEEYARWLHGNTELTARIWASMMDETVYASEDEEMSAANWLVWTDIKYLEDRGYNPRRGDRSGSALADFGAIYKQNVLLRGQDFEEVLARHLEISPYVRRE
jgi:hypothetical protein